MQSKSVKHCENVAKTLTWAKNFKKVLKKRKKVETFYIFFYFNNFNGEKTKKKPKQLKLTQLSLQLSRDI